MKKKFLYLLVFVCVLFLSSCRVVVDDYVTGDVKEQGEIQSPDVVESPEKEAESGAEVTETVEEKRPDASDDVPNNESFESLLKSFSAVVSDGGEYKADAVRFCEAVVSKDAETFAEFTGGKAEYYDFLSTVEIASYNLIPFEVSPVTLEGHIYHGDYPVASDNYLVEFDVISSDCEEFAVGKCTYYAGFEMNPLSGNVLSVFVPAEEADKNMYSWCVVPFTETFAKEFASLYPIQSPLYEGRNYADSFDFSKHSHLITHLMAKDAEYEYPPYTFEEVNSFITERFDGNKGITYDEINSDIWTPSLYYDNYEDGRIYGCSYAHGGTSVVSGFPKIVVDGSRTTLTLDVYADFSKVAKAYTFVFHFDKTEDGYDCLTMVELRNNTGRETAILSI